jgi:hypothetical protein
MTREELIEVMARAILQDFEDGADMSTHPVPERAASRNARAALAALEAAGVRLVPVNATLEMKDKGSLAGLHAAGQPAQDIYGSIFRAMLAASPYAPPGG